MLRGLTSLRGGRRSFARASGPDVACTQPSAATQAIYVGHAAVFRGTSAGAAKVEVLDSVTLALVATAVGTTTWAATVTETAGRETSARTYTIRATDAGGATKDVTVTVVVESKMQGHVAKICARYVIERCCTPETASYLTDAQGVTRWYDTSRKGIVLTDGIRTTAGTLNNKHFSQDTDANQPTTAEVNGDVVLTNRDNAEWMTGDPMGTSAAAWTAVLQWSYASFTALATPWAEYRATGTMRPVVVASESATSTFVLAQDGTKTAKAAQVPTAVSTQYLYAFSWSSGTAKCTANGVDSAVVNGGPAIPASSTSYLFRGSPTVLAMPADATVGLVLWASEAIAAADLTTNGWLDNELKSMLGTY